MAYFNFIGIRRFIDCQRIHEELQFRIESNHLAQIGL